MAWFASTVTLTGSAQQLFTPGAVPKPIIWIRIESDTGNAAVQVGDSTVSATVYGASVLAGPAAAVTFGTGDIPKMNLESIWVIGTNTQKIRITGNTA